MILSLNMDILMLSSQTHQEMECTKIEQIMKIAPEKIVYVSCNSATQARDLALMDEKYKVTRVRPVDMFPQTHHVENVVL
jgi:tRNA/tmRNA/rRNA uracil-C5-methylase (TrmA/RlmC/RlmD family)